MQFGGTVLYVDDVSAVVDFYRRAFGLLDGNAPGYAGSNFHAGGAISLARR
jgi:hypothetical protein